MRKHLKNYFIPHKENDFKPHLFREISVALVLALVLILFVVSVSATALVGRSKFGAAIYTALLFDLTNQDRIHNAAGQLAQSSLLEQAARLKAEDMLRQGYFSHNSPQGLTPWYWFNQVGYKFSYAGENLAVDFSDTEAVENAWMNSPGHRANILNTHFKEIGIATTQGVFEGKDTIFVVQMFGTPAPVAAQTLAGASLDEGSAPLSTLDTRTTVTPTVASASSTQETSPVPVAAAPKGIETISENDMFVVVKNTQLDTQIVDGKQTTTSASSLSSTTASTTALATVGQVPYAQHTTWYERLLVNPSRAVGYVYIGISLIVFLSLLLMIMIEVETQHPRNIWYGVLLLAVTLVLMYLNREMVFTSVMIV